MSIIYLFVPLAAILTLFAVWGFYYAVKSSQFEDLQSDSERIILDDKQLQRQIKNSNNQAKHHSDTAVHRDLN